MQLFELNDFEFWEDMAGERGVYAFSPLFIYILLWADENNLLTVPDNCSVFKSEFDLLVNGEVEFEQFVDKALDGKLLDLYFDESVRKFVRDYIEYDGYTDDLSKFFKRNMWELSCDISDARRLSKVIEFARSNYLKNQRTNPDIISFENQ